MPCVYFDTKQHSVTLKLQLVIWGFNVNLLISRLLPFCVFLITSLIKPIRVS